METGFELNAMWMWAALAAILLVGEMITTSFVLVFFAVAAMLTAVLVTLRPMDLAVQLIIFAVLGLLGLVFGRKWIKAKARAQAAPPVDLDSNAEFTIDRALAPKAEGAVLYQGAPWTAVNDGPDPIQVGDRVKVVRTSGIKIVIQKK